MQTHDLVSPALSDSEREQYWAEAKLYAALFGVRQADLPSDWTSFAAYTEAMLRSDSLAVSPAARDIAEQIFSGSATGLRMPGWYRALTAHLLPERLREEFGFEFGEREAAQHEASAGVDPAHLSPPSHATARGGPLSGSDGALARR